MKPLEQFNAIKTYTDDNGKKEYEYNAHCEPLDDLELALWLQKLTGLSDELVVKRDKLVDILLEYAKQETYSLFVKVQGTIKDVSNGKVLGVFEMLDDVPADSPYWEKLEAACQELKGVWEGVGLRFMDVENLANRWTYLCDSPDIVDNDIFNYLNALVNERVAEMSF